MLGKRFHRSALIDRSQVCPMMCRYWKPALLLLAVLMAMARPMLAGNSFAALASARPINSESSEDESERETDPSSQEGRKARRVTTVQAEHSSRDRKISFRDPLLKRSGRSD